MGKIMQTPTVLTIAGDTRKADLLLDMHRKLGEKLMRDTAAKILQTSSTAPELSLLNPRDQGVSINISP
jgi:hypothetical protein